MNYSFNLYIKRKNVFRQKENLSLNIWRRKYQIKFRQKNKEFSIFKSLKFTWSHDADFPRRILKIDSKLSIIHLKLFETFAATSNSAKNIFTHTTESMFRLTLFLMTLNRRQWDNENCHFTLFLLSLIDVKNRLNLTSSIWSTLAKERLQCKLMVVRRSIYQILLAALINVNLKLCFWNFSSL